MLEEVRGITADDWERFTALIPQIRCKCKQDKGSAARYKIRVITRLEECKDKTEPRLWLCHLFSWVLAHLVERLSGRQKVTGSNPVGSTRFLFFENLLIMPEVGDTNSIIVRKRARRNLKCVGYWSM